VTADVQVPSRASGQVPGAVDEVVLPVVVPALVTGVPMGDPSATHPGGELRPGRRRHAVALVVPTPVSGVVAALELGGDLRAGGR